MDYPGYNRSEEQEKQLKAIKYIEEDNADAITWELETPFNKYRNHHSYSYRRMGYKKFDKFRYSDSLVLFRFRKDIFRELKK